MSGKNCWSLAVRMCDLQLSVLNTWSSRQYVIFAIITDQQVTLYVVSIYPHTGKQVKQQFPRVWNISIFLKYVIQTYKPNIWSREHTLSWPLYHQVPENDIKSVNQIYLRNHVKFVLMRNTKLPETVTYRTDVNQLSRHKEEGFVFLEILSVIHFLHGSFLLLHKLTNIGN